MARRIGPLLGAALLAAGTALPCLARDAKALSAPADSGVPVPEPRPARADDASLPAVPVPIAAPDGGASTGEAPPARPAAKPDGGETPAPAEKPDPDKPDADKPTPAELKTGEVAVTPELAVEAAAAIADAKACEAELKKRGAIFTVGESISEGHCGVLRPVALKTLSNGTTVEPGTTLLCRSALALDHWVVEDVEPEGRARLGAKSLTTLRHASTYVCRARSSESKISEHARGSAIDIASFVFDGGREIGVVEQAPGSPEAAFQAGVRAKACGPFKTVLGPGTDADHATHLHLDIAARRNGATYCK